MHWARAAGEEGAPRGTGSDQSAPCPSHPGPGCCPLSDPSQSPGVPTPGAKDLQLPKQAQRGRRDRTLAPARASGRGRQGAHLGSGPLTSALFLLSGSRPPSPIHTLPGISQHWLFLPLNPHFLLRVDSLSPSLWPLGGFLGGPHYAKCLASFSPPLLLRLSPILSQSSLSCPCVYPYFYLSLLFLIPYPSASYSIPPLLISPCICISCLSFCRHPPLPLLLLISLIGSPAPALLMSPIHSWA